MNRQASDPFDDEWCVVDEWNNTSMSSRMDSSLSQSSNSTPPSRQSSIPARRSIGSRSSSLEEGEIEDDDDDPLFEGTVPLLSSSPKQHEAPKCSPPWSPPKPRVSELISPRRKDADSSLRRISSPVRNDYNSSRRSSTESTGRSAGSMRSPPGRSNLSPDRTDVTLSGKKITSSPGRSDFSLRKGSTPTEKSSGHNKFHSKRNDPASQGKSGAVSPGKSGSSSPAQNETLPGKIVISPKKVQPSKPTGVEKSIKLVLSKSSLAHKKETTSSSVPHYKDNKTSVAISDSNRTPEGLEDGEIMDGEPSEHEHSVKDFRTKIISSSVKEHHLRIPGLERKAFEQAIKSVLQKEKSSSLSSVNKPSLNPTESNEDKPKNSPISPGSAGPSPLHSISSINQHTEVDNCEEPSVKHTLRTSDSEDLDQPVEYKTNQTSTSELSSDVDADAATVEANGKVPYLSDSAEELDLGSIELDKNEECAQTSTRHESDSEEMDISNPEVPDQSAKQINEMTNDKMAGETDNEMDLYDDAISGADTTKGSMEIVDNEKVDDIHDTLIETPAILNIQDENIITSESEDSDGENIDEKENLEKQESLLPHSKLRVSTNGNMGSMESASDVVMSDFSSDRLVIDESASEVDHSLAQASEVDHSLAQASEVDGSFGQASEVDHSLAQASEVDHGLAQASDVDHSLAQASDVDHSLAQASEVKDGVPNSKGRDGNCSEGMRQNAEVSNASSLSSAEHAGNNTPTPSDNSVHTPISVLTCEDCSFSTVDKAQFQKHKKNHVHVDDVHVPDQNVEPRVVPVRPVEPTLFKYTLQTDRFSCSSCGLNTDRRAIFGEHVLRHSIEQSYQCVYCGTAATDTSLILQHLTSCHSQRPVRFAMCHWTSGSQVIKALESESRKHDQEQQVQNRNALPPRRLSIPSDLEKLNTSLSEHGISRSLSIAVPSTALKLTSCTLSSSPLPSPGTSVLIPVSASQSKTSSRPQVLDPGRVFRFHQVTPSSLSGKPTTMKRLENTSRVKGMVRPVSQTGSKKTTLVIPAKTMTKKGPQVPIAPALRIPCIPKPVPNAPMKTRLECMYQHGRFVCKSCQFTSPSDMEFGHHMFYHLHGSRDQLDNKPVYCNVCTSTKASCLNVALYMFCPLVKQMMDLLSKQKAVEEDKTAATKAGISTPRTRFSSPSSIIPPGLTTRNMPALHIPPPQSQVPKAVQSPTTSSASNQMYLLFKQPDVVSPPVVLSPTTSAPIDPIVIEPQSPPYSDLNTTGASSPALLYTTSSITTPLCHVSSELSPLNVNVHSKPQSPVSPSNQPPGLLSPPANGLIVIEPQEPGLDENYGNDTGHSTCKELSISSVVGSCNQDIHDEYPEASDVNSFETTAVGDMGPSETHSHIDSSHTEGSVNLPERQNSHDDEVSTDVSGNQGETEKSSQMQLTSLVRCTYREGKFVCQSCNYQSANPDIFRRHLWKDVHPKRMHCNHCAPEIKFNRFKSCPIMNQLMAVLEKSKISADDKISNEENANIDTSGHGVDKKQKGNGEKDRANAKEKESNEWYSSGSGTQPSSPINVDDDDDDGKVSARKDDSVIEVSDVSFEEPHTEMIQQKDKSDEIDSENLRNDEAGQNGHETHGADVEGTDDDNFQDVIAMIKGLNESQSMASNHRPDSRNTEQPTDRDGAGSVVPDSGEPDNSDKTPNSVDDNDEMLSQEAQSSVPQVEPGVNSDNEPEASSDDEPQDIEPVGLSDDEAADEPQDQSDNEEISDGEQQNQSDVELQDQTPQSQSPDEMPDASDVENQNQSDDREDPADDANQPMTMSESSRQINSSLDSVELRAAAAAAAAENDAAPVCENTPGEVEEPMIVDVNSALESEENGRPSGAGDDQSVSREQPVMSASIDLTADDQEDQDDPVIEIPASPSAEDNDQFRSSRRRASQQLGQDSNEVDGETDTQRCIRCFPREKPARKSRQLATPLLTSSKKDDKKFYACAFLKCNGVAYGDKTSLKLHNLTCHHSAMSFPCAYCTRNLPDSKHLIKHMKKMHTAEDSRIFRLFHCAVDNCFYATNQMMDFRRHNGVVHADSNDYKCVYCNASFPVISNLEQHLEGNLVKLIRCPVCMMTSQSKNKILDHLGNAHPDSPKKIVVTSWVSCSSKPASASQLLGQRLTSGNQARDGGSTSSGLTNGLVSPGESSGRQRSMSSDREMEAGKIQYLCGSCSYVTFKTTEFYQHLQTCKKSPDGAEEDSNLTKEISEPASSEKPEVPVSSTHDQDAEDSVKDVEDEDNRQQPRRSRRKSQPSVREWMDDQIISFLDNSDDQIHTEPEAPHEHENVEEFKCSDCSYIGHIKESFEKHKLLHRGPQDNNKSFTCFHCPFSAYNVDDFRIHLICHRGKQILRIFTCCYCNLTTNQMEFMEDHISDSHEYQIKYTVERETLSRMACPWCHKETSNMGSHVNEAHGRRSAHKYLLEHPSRIDVSPREKRPSISLKIRLPKPPGIEGSKSAAQTPEVISLDVAPPPEPEIPPEIRFQCSFCPYRTDKSDCWFKHIKRHQNAGLYEKHMWRCRCCKWLSTYQVKVLEHVKLRHPMKLPEENVMHLDGTRSTAFDWNSFGANEHGNTSSDGPSRPLVSIERYHCDYCEFSCINDAELHQHLASCHEVLDVDTFGPDGIHSDSHDDTIPDGTSTGNTSPRMAPYTPNRNTEDSALSPPQMSLPLRKNKLFQCDQCPYSTEKRVHINRHKLNHQRFATVNEGFQCGHCKFVSIAQHCVKRHINRYHAGLSVSVLTRKPPPPRMDSDDSIDHTMEEDATVTPDLPPPLAPAPQRVRTQLPEHAPEAVPSLPPALERIDDLEVHIPDEMIFRKSQKCPKCDFTTKVRYNLLRHLKSHQDICLSGDGSVSGADSFARRNSQMSSSEADSVSVGVPGADEDNEDDDKDSAGLDSEITSEGTNSEDEVANKEIKTVISAKELDKYCSKVDGKDLYQCVKCVFMHRYPSKVHRHYSYRHEQTVLFRCPHCNFEAVESANIHRHCLAMHEGLPVPNDEKDLSRRMENCDSLLRDKRFVQKYITKKANNVQECNLCGYQQEGSSAVKRHLFASHFEFYPYKCKYCAYSAVEINKVKKHIRRSHADMPMKIVRNKFRGSLPEIEQPSLGGVENDEEAGLREAMQLPLLSECSQDNSNEPPVLLRADQIKEEPRYMHDAENENLHTHADTGIESEVPELQISQCRSEAIPESNILAPSQIKEEPQDGYIYSNSQQGEIPMGSGEHLQPVDNSEIRGFDGVHTAENEDSDRPVVKVESGASWEHNGNVSSGSINESFEHVSMTSAHLSDSTPERGFGSPPELSPVYSLEKNSSPLLSRSGRVVRQASVKDTAHVDDLSTRKTGQKQFHCSYCGYTSKWNVKDVKHHILLTHLRKYPYMCKYCDSGHRIRNMVEEHIRTNHRGRSISVRIMTNELADQFICITKGMDMNCSFNGFSPSDTIPEDQPLTTLNASDTFLQKSPPKVRSRSIEDQPLDLSTKQTTTSPLIATTRQVDVPITDKVKRTGRWQCKECGYISHQSTKVYIHYLGKHLHKKTYGCRYCDFQFNVRYGVVDHTVQKHPGEEVAVRENLKEHIKLLRDKVVKIKGKRGMVSPFIPFAESTPNSTLGTSGIEETQVGYRGRSEVPEPEVPEPYSSGTATEHENEIPGQKNWVSILKVPSVPSSLQKSYESDSSRSEDPVGVETQDSDSPGLRDAPCEPNEEGVYACDICSFKTSTPRLCRLHRMHHFSYRPYGCGYCSFKNFYKARVRVHMAREHTDKPGKIRHFEQPKYLGEAKPVASARVMHMVAARRKKLYGDTRIPVKKSSPAVSGKYGVKNETATPAASNEKTLRALLSGGPGSTNIKESGGSDTAWKCPQCPVFLDSHMQLQHHIDINHSDYGPYKCGQCGIVIRNKDEILSHLSQVHPGSESIYTTASSPVPGFTGLSSSPETISPARKRARLDEVVEKLVVERSAAAMAADRQQDKDGDPDKSVEDVVYKYFCNHCHFHTYMKATMRHHVMVHVGYRPYRCPHCPYNNIKSYPIKLHVRKMHPDTRGLLYLYRKDKQWEENLQNEYTAKIVDEKEKDSEERGKFQGHKIKKSTPLSDESNMDDTFPTSNTVSETSNRLPPVPESLYETVTVGPDSCISPGLSPARKKKGGSPRQKIKYMCVLCGYRVDYTVTMKRHLMSETNYKPYHCPLCHYRDIQLPGVKRHGQKVHHKGNINVVIKRKEDKEEMLDRLLQECIIDPNAEPPPAPEVVPSLKKRKERPPPAEEEDAFLMDIPEDIPDEIPDVSPVVAKPSKKISSFGGRKVAMKSTRPFTKKLKLKSTKKRKNFEQPPEGPMQCQFCTYSTTNRQLLLVHEVRHGPKRIQCHYCKYQCFFTGEMGKHQRRHHSSRAPRFRHISPEELGSEQYEKHDIQPRKKRSKATDDKTEVSAELTRLKRDPEEEQETMDEDPDSPDEADETENEAGYDDKEEEEENIKPTLLPPMKEDSSAEVNKDALKLLSAKSKGDEKVAAIIDGIEITESWLSKDPRSGCYACQLCDYKTSNREHFKVHFIKHVPPRWQCAFCDYKNQLSYEMKKHIRKYHIGQSADRMIQLHDGSKESIREMSETGSVKIALPKGRTSKSWDTASVASLASVASVASAASLTSASVASASDLSDAASLGANYPRASLVNCSHCSYQTGRIDDLLVHVQRHSRSRSGPTKIVSQNSPVVSRKIKSAAQPIPLKCGFCSFSTDSVEIFNEHSKTHQFMKPFKCGHCDYASFYRKSIMGHSRRHHNDLPLNIIDQKQLNPKQTISRNIKLSPKPAASKKSKSKRRSLFGQRKFKCPYCTMSSLYRFSVSKHMKNYHPEHPPKPDVEFNQSEPKPDSSWGSVQWQPRVVLQDIAQLGFHLQEDDDDVDDGVDDDDDDDVGSIMGES